MIDQTKVYYFIFGALTIAGGVMGYVKKSSLPSLIAGGLCGVLLFIAGLLLKDKPQVGLAIGLVVSLVLAAQFVPAFIQKHNFMPAGLMSILSVIGIILTALAFAKR